MVTISVMDELVYVSTVLNNQRLLINNCQPGMRMANNTLQNILCPPFKYRWNRKTKTQTINTAGGTDYVVSWPDLGWIETQWMTDSDGNIAPQIEGKQSLSRNAMKKRPSQVAPVYDDNQGNVTVRVDAIPDAAYTLYFDYQAAPRLLTSPASTFGPVPDQLSYLYTKWMLAEGAMLLEDARQPQFLRDAVYSLLAMQDGMSEQEKSIMAEQMLNAGNSGQRSQFSTKLGAQARGTL